MTPRPPPRNILVIRRRYFGDLVLLIPFVSNLKMHHGACRVTLVVDAPYRDVLAGHPDVDEVRVLPVKRSGEGVAAFARRWLTFVRELRRTGFDVAYDLTQNERSALVSRLSGARHRVTVVRGSLKPHHYLSHLRIRFDPEEEERLHTAELYLKVLAEDGVPVRTTEVSFPVSEEERRRGRERLEAVVGEGEAGDAERRDPPGPLVVAHPGARTPNKLWPTERFGRVCAWARRELGARVVLVAGPGEGDLLGAVREAAGAGLADLGTDLSIPELRSVLAGADLLFGHDTGPMHLAAAVGTPVVAIFGGTSVAKWAPRGEGHRVVQAPVPCTCIHPELCEPPNPYLMFCVRRVTEEQVREAMARTVAEVGAVRG